MRSSHLYKARNQTSSKPSCEWKINLSPISCPRFPSRVSPQMEFRVVWVKQFPRWLGMVFAIFGLANIVGALSAWGEMTFPGVVIGFVWFIVGVKRGLSLLPSVAFNTGLPEERIVLGIGTIRRRRLIAFLGIFAWLPISAIILSKVPPHLIGLAFFGTVLPLFALFVVWGLSACPRCDQHFYPVGRFRFTFSLSRCQSCGLELRNG
jgi:hypothetical protein